MSYEKTSSVARRPDRTGHRWSANWFSGRSEESKRTDRPSGRSGIWPHYADGLGTWADRIGARKFKLRHDRHIARHPVRTRYALARPAPSFFAIAVAPGPSLHRRRISSGFMLGLRPL